MDTERLITLLKATYNWLENLQENNPNNYIHLMSTTVFYDGTNCDGFCLQDDIEAELDCISEDWRNDV